MPILFSRSVKIKNKEYWGGQNKKNEFHIEHSDSKLYLIPNEAI